LYDPDPLAGTGAVSGFVELCALYSHYRVTSVDVDWEVGNYGSAPIFVYSYPTVPLVTPATVQGAISQSETPYATPVHMIAPVGSTPNTTKFPTVNIDLAKLYGNRIEYYSSEDFAGLATTAPAGPATSMYLIFVAYSSNTWSYNLNSSIRLRYNVDFYGKYPTSV
jgi:hypothetical protein